MPCGPRRLMLPRLVTGVCAIPRAGLPVRELRTSGCLSPAAAAAALHPPTGRARPQFAAPVAAGPGAVAWSWRLRCTVTARTWPVATSGAPRLARGAARVHRPYSSSSGKLYHGDEFAAAARELAAALDRDPEDATFRAELLEMLDQVG